VSGESVSILAESNLENIIESISGQDFSLVIIDSISVISSDNANGVSGSLNQIKYIGERFQEFAKTTNTALYIIGHITKDGSIA
jgi:DNA repair protein RadA/Sms